jgi:uncharacterized protein YjaG (DUF416 family)
MTYPEFTNTFKRQVDKLSYQRQIELSISVCKKLFFDYQKFYEENRWGNPDILLDAINLVEQSRTIKPNRTELETILWKINEVTPDTEDFGGANYAVNASGAIYETIEFLLDRKPEHIYNIGTYLIETVDSKVQDDDDLSEDEIDQHPKMVEIKNYLLAETE